MRRKYEKDQEVEKLNLLIPNGTFYFISPSNWLFAQKEVKQLCLTGQNKRCQNLANVAKKLFLDLPRVGDDKLHPVII